MDANNREHQRTLPNAQDILRETEVKRIDHVPMQLTPKKTVGHCCIGTTTESPSTDARDMTQKKTPSMRGHRSDTASVVKKSSGGAMITERRSATAKCLVRQNGVHRRQNQWGKQELENRHKNHPSRSEQTQFVGLGFLPANTMSSDRGRRTQYFRRRAGAELPLARFGVRQVRLGIVRESASHIRP